MKTIPQPDHHIPNEFSGIHSSFLGFTLVKHFFWTQMLFITPSILINYVYEYHVMQSNSLPINKVQIDCGCSQKFVCLYRIPRRNIIILFILTPKRVTRSTNIY